MLRCVVRKMLFDKKMISGKRWCKKKIKRTPLMPPMPPFYWTREQRRSAAAPSIVWRVDQCRGRFWKNESRGVRLHATKWHTWCGQKTKKMVATTTLPTCTHDGVGNCIGQQEVPTFWWWKRVQTNSPWHPHWNQGHRPWFETSPLIKRGQKIEKIIGGNKKSWIETMINGRKSKNNG